MTRFAERGQSATTFTVATLVCAMATLAIGCKKETVGALGAPTQEKGAPIAVTLAGFTLERVELEGPDGPLIYGEPVLALSLTFANKGEANFLYKPTHDKAKTTNLEAPILFVDPGPKARPSNPIEAVLIEEGLLAGQQTQNVDLAPGKSVTDIYLFKAPEEGQRALVLTVPPSLHGGSGMMLIKMTYEPTALPEVVVHNIGEAVKVGSATLTVQSAKIEYVKLKEGAKDGFSKDPVLKITYEIKNDGAESITYDPNHQTAGKALAPALHEEGGGGRFMRARFGADRTVVDQTASAVSINAGKSLQDFALFERPPETIKELRLLLPGKIFGQPGLVRVKMPYKYDSPKNPVEP